MALPVGDFTPKNYKIPETSKFEDCKKIFRRIFYPIHNYIVNKYLRYKLKSNKLMPDLWLWGQRGNDYDRHRKRVSSFINIANKNILIAGCGTARDIESWLKYSPSRVIGVDLFSYDTAWELWKAKFKNVSPNTNIEFIQANLENIETIENSSIDIISSDAVFEHVKNLDKVLEEFYRILKPGGIIYSTFGPLWYAWGGDHVSGYENINSGFNHLILAKDEYKAYLNNMGNYNHDEHDGRTWIEHDLFSKLKCNEYIEKLSNAHFKRKFVSAIIDPRSHKCLKNVDFDLSRYNNLDKLDLLVTGMTIIYEK